MLKRIRKSIRLTSLVCLSLTLSAVQTKTMAATAEWLPQNQSLNILDNAAQILMMDYVQITSNPSRDRCSTQATNRARRLGEDKRAIFYYHQDSNFLGVPDGSGHCYMWIYDPNAPRSALLTSVLLASVKDGVPPELQSLVGNLPGIEDAQRKINGLHFQHFGFHATESSDVCLKKVNDWRLSKGYNWAVWSHQANNCIGIASKESFVSNSCPRELSRNTLANSLKLNIRTGGDDLRGGSQATAFVVVGGRELTVNLNNGQGWGNNTWNTRTMELPSGTRLGDIQTFGVRFKSGKSGVFDTGDNWNMDNIKVTFAGSSNCSGTLIEQQGSPFVRFTGDRREWRTNVRIP